MRRLILWLAFAGWGVLLLPSLGMAEASDDWIDADKDGRKESHVFYEDKKIVRIEKDKNGDGKIDSRTVFENELPVRGEEDKDGDGKTDQWILYNAEGHSAYRAVDSNRDGKPDQYMNYLQGGREFVLKEYDRNYDGKIDKRIFSRWDPNHKIPVPDGPTLRYVPNPGYISIWKEADEDYDGKIDQFTSKDKSMPNRTGLPMDPNSAKPAVAGQKNTDASTGQAEAGAPEKKPKNSKDDKKSAAKGSQGLINAMNERYGYSS